jgi:BMFP domain-containing protein YqiC
MADDKAFDPSAQFQEFVSNWERSVDQFFNQSMATEQFSQSMNEMQKLQLELQKTFKDVMAAQLINMNMPSRSDVLQISEDIRQLDLRMARIEDKLSATLGHNEHDAARRSPPRTKRPPSQED